MSSSKGPFLVHTFLWPLLKCKRMIIPLYSCIQCSARFPEDIAMPFHTLRSYVKLNIYHYVYKHVLIELDDPIYIYAVLN